MNADREYVCPGCKGRVRVPKGSRKFTIDTIKTNHQVSCPSRRAAT